MIKDDLHGGIFWRFLNLHKFPTTSDFVGFFYICKSIHFNLYACAEMISPWERGRPKPGNVGAVIFRARLQ